ncbi:putative Cytochrome c oxidase assembly protein PET191-domain-containing protein [Seiridium cardinale]|uniref:Cytochrome c oxidase assembly protein PET191-domain-containing protein n=1 Tax=Seiridium cardinale TaxID=138064 RepID=A0ABR2XZ71_9PEZI
MDMQAATLLNCATLTLATPVLQLAAKSRRSEGSWELSGESEAQQTGTALVSLLIGSADFSSLRQLPPEPSPKPICPLSGQYAELVSALLTASARRRRVGAMPSGIRLKKGFGECRRGMIDMRKRFRGNQPITFQNLSTTDSGEGYQLYAGKSAFGGGVKKTDGNEPEPKDWREVENERYRQEQQQQEKKR